MFGAVYLVEQRMSKHFHEHDNKEQTDKINETFGESKQSLSGRTFDSFTFSLQLR